MEEQFKPLDGDNDASTIVEMFDVRADNWILTASGDYRTAAGETFQEDGSMPQKVVILEWPGRYNHSTETVTVRLMMGPGDALGLADNLAQSAQWLIEHGYNA